MARSARGTVRIGIGGWTYEPWRGLFYPPGLPHSHELAHASSKLTSIEVNSTFYKSQTPTTFAKWRDETPDGFVFSLKAPRFATNRRVLAQAGPSIDRFLASGITELGDKLGPINWQFAPTKAFDAADMEAFLSLLPKRADGRTLRHAVEVRHESFRDPAFVDLARRHGVAVVMAGDSDYVQIADPTADFAYLRIMGTRDGEPLGYPDAALDLWAARAESLATGLVPDGLQTAAPAKPPGRARDLYLYVISGDKHRNPAAAMALMARLN